MPKIIVKKPAKEEQLPAVFGGEAVPATVYLPVQDRAQLQAFVKKMNHDMKGVGRIDLGADITWMDPPRIRTGILGIDVASRGGLPRGGIVQFWGPYSSGKTTSAMHAMRAEQRLGNPTAFCAGEGFSKDWARKNGLWIPYSADEYRDVAADDRYSVEVRNDIAAQMAAYDEWGTVQGFGPLVVMQHVHGDGLLEGAARAVKANVFSIVTIDSLAILRNERQLEEMEIGQEEMGGGGQISMFNRFMGRVFSALNTKYTADNEPDMNGQRGNLTCVLCLNQARIKFGVSKIPGQVSYKPVGGEGIAHAWHFSLQFRRGEELGEKETLGDKQNWTPWGTEIKVTCDKSKIGPKGRTAMWDLYTEDHEAFKAGDVDSGKEARLWGVYYNVIEVNGAWYSYRGERIANGKDNVDAALRANDALRGEIEQQVIDICRR